MSGLWLQCRLFHQGNLSQVIQLSGRRHAGGKGPSPRPMSLVLACGMWIVEKERGRVGS